MDGAARPSRSLVNLQDWRSAAHGTPLISIKVSGWRRFRLHPSRHRQGTNSMGKVRIEGVTQKTVGAARDAIHKATR